MSDTPTLPPSGASAIGSGHTSSAQQGPVAGSHFSGLMNLGVRNAPAHLAQPSSPVTLEGTVIYSNPGTEEIRIRTEQGEITVQSSKNLPHGTEVLIKLHRFKQETLANITVLEKQAETVDEALRMLENIPPPAALKEGDSIKASLLPPALHANAVEVTQLLSTLTNEELSALQLPLDTLLTQQLLDNRTTAESILKTLPASVLTEILSILISHRDAKTTTPDQHRKLHTAYRPEYAAATHPAPSASRDEDILQSLLLGKNPPSSPSPKTGAPAGQTLLALQEVQGKTPGTEEKLYRIDVFKILPPALDSKQLKEAMALAQHEFLRNDARYHTPEYGALPLKSATFHLPAGASFPVLHTDGTETEQFAIKQAVTAEEGSIVLFKAVPMAEMPLSLQEQVHALAATLHQPASDRDLIQRPRWPALEETLRVLHDLSPPTAQAVQRALPAPGTSMVPSVLFLLAALRAGSVESWLGANTLKLLRDNGRKELADILSQDFQRLSGLAKDSSAENWRIFSLPLLYEEKLEQVPIFVRDEQDTEQDKSGGLAKRFIINLHLSRMGKLQLDGRLYRKTQLDMIIRTETPLDTETRQQLMQRYAAGLEQIPLQGSLRFQSTPQDWVHVPIKSDNNLI